MSMNTTEICDYSDYDYKTEFWNKSNRNYEHALETTCINQLLQLYAPQCKSILDAGCGYGRLFNAYKQYFNDYHLVDYASNLLEQAKESYQHISNISFYKQSLYELSLPLTVDAIISIRTLHHLNNLDLLFHKFYQALSPGGILILDIPNYYHIKNKLKFPFKAKQPTTALSTSFYNYDPTHVIDKLKKTGFNIIDQRQLGLFRIGLIKRFIPSKTLVMAETYINYFIKMMNIAPSVYVIGKKCG